MSRFRKIKKKKGKKKMGDKKQPEQPQPQPGPPGQPKVVGTVTIDVYEDMNVNVRGFPTDHAMSILVLGNAILAVNNWFHEQNQKNKSNIVLSKGPVMSLEQIEKIKRNN